MTAAGKYQYNLFSGQDAAAGEHTRRKCRMMEIEPRYCDVTIARWERITGKQAARIK